MTSEGSFQSVALLHFPHSDFGSLHLHQLGMPIATFKAQALDCLESYLSSVYCLNLKHSF